MATGQEHWKNKQKQTNRGCVLYEGGKFVFKHAHSMTGKGLFVCLFVISTHTLQREKQCFLSMHIIRKGKTVFMKEGKTVFFKHTHHTKGQQYFLCMGMYLHMYGVSVYTCLFHTGSHHHDSTVWPGRLWRSQRPIPMSNPRRHSPVSQRGMEQGWPEAGHQPRLLQRGREVRAAPDQRHWARGRGGVCVCAV